ncbi:pfkB family kinase [Penicillium cosmopolitanum]|uniref:PfkB family kinase n=1 Tax=Penicillium cosmopolitanum TaxID=1131564 RepID=A0A9X0B326_9EURO|nr:pfkB family kinase [Penicillium cosmopolitanum]KAJ5386298.1 pfkB family kinase [Penicillium cosmopolitanum]
MSIVAVGALYVDTILTTPHCPEEDEKLRASHISIRRGGNCPNTLEVLQQLANTASEHLPLNLVTVLPTKSSAICQKITSELEQYVNMQHCIYREEFSEPASSYIIKSQSTGSRTIVNYNELPDLTVDEFIHSASKLAHGTAWFHFEGRTPDVILACICYLQKNFPSVRVSVEVEKPGRVGLQELAKAANVVFYSKSWATVKGYSSAEACLLEQSTQAPNASLLCCTWGKDGACALEPATGKFVHAPAYTEDNFQVIDPIGAGDTFIAGMLYAMNCKEKEWDISQKLKFANRLAGIKVSQEGFSGLGRAILL